MSQYDDMNSTRPLIVHCTRCSQDGRPKVIAGQRGVKLINGIIKIVKAHVDAEHGDWNEGMNDAIAGAVFNINAGGSDERAPGLIIRVRDGVD